MAPRYCPVEYDCVSVSKMELMAGYPEPISCQDLSYDFAYDGDAEDGTLTFEPTIEQYTNFEYPPGDYAVIIKGTAAAATEPDSEEITITMTLVDPCDPPLIVEAVLLP